MSDNDISLGDTGSGSDSPTIFTSFSEADMGCFAEFIPEMSFVINQENCGIDYIQLTNHLPIADTGTISEVISRLFTQLNIPETGIDSETVSLLVRRTFIDLGCPEELLVLTNRFTITHGVCSLDDVYPINNYLNIPESGTITERFAQVNTFTIGEVRQAIEQLFLTNRLQILLVGYYTDYSYLTVRFGLPDTLLGEDMLAFLTNRFTLTDAPLTTEIMNFIMYLALQENPIVTEDISFKNFFTLLEEGAGEDIFSLLVYFNLADSLHATDTARKDVVDIKDGLRFLTEKEIDINE